MGVTDRGSTVQLIRTFLPHLPFLPVLPPALAVPR